MSPRRRTSGPGTGPQTGPGSGTGPAADTRAKGGGPSGGGQTGGGAARTRVDKWLWHARFFKTRGLAAKQVTGGHVRVNGAKVLKSSFGVQPGDTLTFTVGRRVRIIRVAAPSTRRGPAPEAQSLYEDLSPPAPPKPAAAPGEGRIGGRPTKKDRRALDLSRRDHLE